MSLYEKLHCVNDFVVFSSVISVDLFIRLRLCAAWFCQDFLATATFVESLFNLLHALLPTRLIFDGQENYRYYIDTPNNLKRPQIGQRRDFNWDTQLR